MRDRKTGLTVEQHRELAQVKAVRNTVRNHLGSADVAYGAATKALNAVGALQTALLFTAAGEHAGAVSMTELRTLYNGNGEG
jgi:hypothetical protein